MVDGPPIRGGRAVPLRLPQRVLEIELPQFDVLNERAAHWRAKGADVINLGQAIPGFPPPPSAIDALRQSIDQADSHVYSADAGLSELRSALADSLKMATGASVDPETEIIVTAGGNQAFQLAITTLLEPGDEVVLAAPYFLNHEMAVRSVGAIAVEAPGRAETGFVPTWDELEPFITNRTRAMVLVSPSNPTGAIIPAAELRRIVDRSAERGLVVFVDETYLQFVFDGPPQSASALPDWRESVVVVGSFSKAFAITGWRCGYLIAAPTVIQHALKIQDCMVICAPVPIQKAVAAALRHEPDYPRQRLDEFRQRRDVLLSTLATIPRIQAVRPGGGFFMMVGVHGVTNSEHFAGELIDSQHLVTIPGRFFGKCGEGFLRLSFGAVDATRLREACHRLAAAGEEAGTAAERMR
jgi:aspartate/methionine/tyrosine aminotransferase